MLLKAFFIAALYVHTIDLQQFHPNPAYSNISLSIFQPRDCSLKQVTFAPVRVSNIQSRLITHHVTCLESVLHCVQSPTSSADVSCSDPSASIHLYIDGVQFQGVVLQLSAEAPVNQSELRICQRERLHQKCAIGFGRYTDQHHRMSILVKFKVERNSLEDDCSEFRKLYAMELESCKKKSMKNQQNTQKSPEMNWITICTITSWFYPSVEIIGLALYDLIRWIVYKKVRSQKKRESYRQK